MGLQSKHFGGDPQLEACLIDHSAHVVEGASGDHVRKIQVALKALDNLNIDVSELTARRYGPSTAAAVLAFKKKRRIINPTYQTKEDNIVGKMTIDALDKEMKRKEGGGSAISPDMQLVNSADMRRLAALAKAEVELHRLKSTFEPNVPDANDPTVEALQRQMFLPMDSNFWSTVDQILSMITTNKLTRAPFLIDKSSTDFAHVDPSNQPGKGITFGASFFNTNDNCRQEVITHEFFHFIVGLQHFYSTTTLAEALRCPHHLARVVFDIAVGQQLAPCAATGNICR